MTAKKKTTTKGARDGKAKGNREAVAVTNCAEPGESFHLTPDEAAALVGSWDTNGDEHSGDLILLCRALALSDRRHAEDILYAVEKEIAPMSPTVYGALDRLVSERRAVWQKEVSR
jgi:hypothetical protein